MAMPLWWKRDEPRTRYEPDELSERMQTAAEKLNHYAAAMKMLVEQDPNGGTNDESGQFPEGAAGKTRRVAAEEWEHPY